jgi:predicted protein tyrosine phosphatase
VISRLRNVVVAVALLAVVATLREPLLRSAGRALVVNEELASSDVVVVPEWSHAAGALEAADLVHNGLASRVVVLLDAPDAAETELVRRGLQSPTQASWLVSLLNQLNVQQVESITDSGNGTEAESRALPEFCERHQWRSIIVVSLPDHARRLRRLLRRSMRGRPIRVIVRASRYSSFDPDSWWRTRSGIRTQLQESEKLLLDLALHPFS